MHACHAGICSMHIKKKKFMVPLFLFFLFFLVGMKNKVIIFLNRNNFDGKSANANFFSIKIKNFKKKNSLIIFLF